MLDKTTNPILDVTDFPWIKDPVDPETDVEHAYLMGQVVARLRTLLDDDDVEQIVNFGAGASTRPTTEVDIDRLNAQGLGTFGIWTEISPADLDLYQRLLPANCSMPEKPVVSLWIADYNQPNPIVRYREAGVMLKALGADGKEGLYVHSMPVESWLMLVVGHDWGFRKELTDITVSRDRASVLQKDGKLYMSLELTGDDHPADVGPSPAQDGSPLGAIVIYPRSPEVMLRTSYAGRPTILEERRKMVKITVNRALDWAGLVPEAAVAPGSYRRFVTIADHYFNKVRSN
jgi:hypothetical protein